MSTTARPRPFSLDIDNAEARRLVEAGLEGSTFGQVPTRRFCTYQAAVARARNILSDQYDPRLNLTQQPVAFVESDEICKAFVILPHVGFRQVDQITDRDRQRSAEAQLKAVAR